MNNRKFISFEGIDFSGKTTQIEILRQKLVSIGEKVIVIREPGGTYLSEQIRNILLDNRHQEMTEICETFLYSAARNQLVVEKIIPELESGKFIIADRYSDSTTAYQGFGRGISLDLIAQINRAATKNLMPCLTFFLNLDLSEFQQRKTSRGSEADRLEKSGEEFYCRIRKGYLKIAELEPKRIKIINAANSIEEISGEIWEFVSQKMKFNNK